jgi:hypothetical protein
LTSALPTTGLGQAATCCKMATSHTPRTLTARCLLLHKINAYGQQYADHQNIFFLPAIVSTHARRVFASSFSTGPPGDRGALHCRWNVIAKLPLGLVPFQARGILSVTEEQSRPRSVQSGGVEDQHQYRGLWHNGSCDLRLVCCRKPAKGVTQGQTESGGGIVLAAICWDPSAQTPGGVHRKRRCTYRPSVIY